MRITQILSNIQPLALLPHAAGTVFILLCFLFYGSYGFDFTDDAYYAIWITSPFDYKVSASQFGSFYKFFFDLLGGSIAALRRFNIVVTFALAWTLSYLLTRKLYGDLVEQAKYRVAIAFSLSSAVFLHFQNWLLTPSYNSLAFQGCMLIAVGMLLVFARFETRFWLNVLVIGVGGWVCFMGKPSTAAVMGVLVLLYLTSFGRQGWFVALGAMLLSFSLLIVSAVLIDGSVSEFSARLGRELHFQSLYGTKHDLFSALRFGFFPDTKTYDELLVYVTLASIFVLVFLLMRLGRQLAGLLVFAFILAAYFVDVYTWPGAIAGFLGETRYFYLIFIVPAFVVMLMLLAVDPQAVVENWRDRVILGTVFLLMPHAYAFGTFSNYLTKASFVGIFWFFSALIYVSVFKFQKDRVLKNLLILGLCFQMIAFIALRHGMHHPYRQPFNISQNVEQVELGTPESVLVLANGFANYIESAKKLALEAGFKPRTPVIDVTGQSPGILYAIKGKILGRPSMGGGYAGSDIWAISLLSVEECMDLSTAWVLAEPHGPRSLSPKVLASFGASLPDDYTIVGELQTASGAGGYTKPRRQLLYKPARSVESAVNACRQKKDVVSDG